MLVDRATADAYYAARGVTAWAALTTEARDGALLYAEDYVRTRYSCANWEGWNEEPPDPELPADVEQAIIELAGWHALVSPLNTGLATSPSDGAVKREKLGAMETEYTDRATTMSGAEFEKWIDALLAGECSKIASGGSTVCIVRA